MLFFIDILKKILFKNFFYFIYLSNIIMIFDISVRMKKLWFFRSFFKNCSLVLICNLENKKNFFYFRINKKRSPVVGYRAQNEPVLPGWGVSFFIVNIIKISKNRPYMLGRKILKNTIYSRFCACGCSIFFNDIIFN